MHLCNDFVDVVRSDSVLLAEKTQQQQAITDRVDAPWNTATCFMDRLIGRAVKTRATLGAYALEPMLHIAARLVLVHRADMTCRRDALA